MSKIKIDRINLKAALFQCVTQELVQFSKNEEYVLLDPESGSKLIARLITDAAKHEGLTDGAVLAKKVNGKTLKLLFKYLENDGQVFSVDTNKWLFPSAAHRKKVVLSDMDTRVLESDSIMKDVNFKGPGLAIFTRVIVLLKAQFGIPEYVSTTGVFWSLRSGREKTVALLQVEFMYQSNMLLLKVGGGQSRKVFDEIIRVFESVCSIYK